MKINITVEKERKNRFKNTKDAWWNRGPKYWRDNPINYFVQMKHYKLWKNIWLSMFVIFLGLSIILELSLNWTLKDNLAEIISLKIAVIALFGSLFASANKNYRIYANLYDQTKFRSVVAKTIQGIILDDTRIDNANKGILLTVAAQSLFEMKPNGHLTKKDSGSPVNDLLVSLISRKE